GDGKVEGSWVAVACKPVDSRAAGIAEAEQPRPLVERLPGGVVDRGAEHVWLAAAVLDVEQHRVPAARAQAEKRRLQRIGLAVERRDVPMQVVDGGERQPPRPRDRLRSGDTD